MGTLDEPCVIGEKMMSVSDGRVVQFPRLLGEVWGQEAAGDGIDQYSVRHVILFSSRRLLK